MERLLLKDNLRVVHGMLTRRSFLSWPSNTTNWRSSKIPRDWSRFTKIHLPWILTIPDYKRYCWRSRIQVYATLYQSNASLSRNVGDNRLIEIVLLVGFARQPGVEFLRQFETWSDSTRDILRRMIFLRSRNGQTLPLLGARCSCFGRGSISIVMDRRTVQCFHSHVAWQYLLKWDCHRKSITRISWLLCMFFKVKADLVSRTLVNYFLS